ncbi:matrilin-2-like [Haliotis asinina]|uniref:matrilin-2-like n=1 Tax=Haliotis asinina TaxID=109174 RepID=UPI003531A167
MKPLLATIVLLALMKDSDGRTPSPLFTCSDSSNVVLVVDRSQSVAGSFGAVQIAVNNFITEIANNNLNINVGLVYYDNFVVQQQPLTRDVNALLSFVAFQSAGSSGTRTDLALQEAINMLQTSPLPATSGSIIVVTDGISQLPTQTAAIATAARDATYTLFAVGINVVDNNFSQELYDITRDSSQVRQVADVNQLSTVMANIARSLCAYTVCNGCAVDGGTRITEHPYRCDKFYLCERRPGEQMKAYEKVCPIGSLFHRRERTCKPSRSILRDPTSGCSNCVGAQQNFPVGDYCEIYYTCGVIEGEAVLNVNCCPTSQRYDSNLGACTPDNTCQRQRYEDKASCRSYYSCDGPSTTFVSTCCNSNYFNASSQLCVVDTNCKGSCDTSVYHRCGELQRNPADNCTYFQQSGTNLIQMNCPGGTSFSETECRCVRDSSCVAPTTSCEPDVIITVTPSQTSSWGFSETSPKRNWIDVKNVTYQGGTIRLAGRDNFVSVPYYANNDRAFVKNTAFFRVNVKDDLVGLSGNTQEMVVLSNMPCPGGKSEAGIEPSVWITMRPSTGEVRFGVRTVTGQATVSVTYFPTNSDDWKELTMRYSQSPGLLEGRVILYSFDAFGNRIFNGQEFSGTNSTASGRILTSDCAIKLGSGSYTDISLAGQIDNVAFYTSCDSNAPAVNALNIPV